jgi:hypothetical protein
LIDADILHKRMNEEIRDLTTEEDRECLRYADSLIDSVPTAKAIPIEWMRKELVEMMYDGERVTEKDRYILNKLIDRWEKQNDRRNCD